MTMTRNLGTRWLASLPAHNASVCSRRNSGALTDTCLGSVAPVTGGTRELTIFRIRAAAALVSARRKCGALNAMSQRQFAVNS